jgi:hypothetical protein
VYRPNPERVQDAEVAIAAFEQSIAPPVWALNKATIIAEMRARVRDPFQVNQGGQPFCGPASVLVELIYKQPRRYVELCQSLFLVGGFQGVTQYMASSETLRRVSQGDLKMPQVDWMILATLRDLETRLFPVEPGAPDLIRNLAGMTKSWEMKGWVREILGYKTVEYHHAYLFNDTNAMNQAAKAIGAGGVAFALVTAEGMLTDKPPLIPYPSHWITLLGNISVQAEPVTFDLYTWSRQMRLKLDMGSFKKYLWAVVTGVP